MNNKIRILHCRSSCHKKTYEIIHRKNKNLSNLTTLNKISTQYSTLNTEGNYSIYANKNLNNENECNKNLNYNDCVNLTDITPITNYRNNIYNKKFERNFNYNYLTTNPTTEENKNNLNYLTNDENYLNDKINKLNDDNKKFKNKNEELKIENEKLNNLIKLQKKKIKENEYNYNGFILEHKNLKIGFLKKSNIS